MTSEHYRNVIIGSGEGGKSIAWYLAAQGERTIVIERRWIGGSCPNINCLPSKNEIWSAKVADLVRRAAQFGVKVPQFSIDMHGVVDRKRRMVADLVRIHLDKYRATGAELVMGSARFVGPKTTEIALNDGGMRKVTGDRIFLNLGTRAALPQVAGLAAAGPLTHIEMLELDHLPEHLIVVGGGYVGLEFAQAYRRFGSAVTIVQHGSQLLAGQDPDAAEAVRQLLGDEGIEILTSTELTGVAGKSGENVTVTVKSAAGERLIHGTHLLIATGRIPNTAGIGLEQLGVRVDQRGWVQVNDRLETTAADVWAMGECAGTPQFTHVSYDDYRIIRDNLAGGKRTTTNRVIPSCLYTDPSLAHIGLTETEARRSGKPFRVARIPMGAVLRSRTLDETRGFMKALMGDDDRILGFTMLGPEAGEVMAVMQTAMLSGVPFTVLRDAIIAHPTMAEGLNVLLSAVKPA